MSATLSYVSVVNKGHPPPERWCLVLHGILGTKSNLRTVARRVVETKPAWGLLLVDLRNHGESRAGFAPPHTLDASARDLTALRDALGLRVDAVVGHSYGGKVALAYGAQVAGALDALVVIDATPSARTDARGAEETVRIVALLGELGPGPFATREAFMEQVIADGHSRDIAAWLAMNLERDGGAWKLGVDPAAIRAMLDDHLSRDLWPVVESPPGRMTLELVIGARSRAFDDADRTRALAAQAAHPDRVHVHVVEAAGHWVHVDAPDFVVELLTRVLR